MLDAGEAPERPVWIESFYTTEGEFSDLTESVSRFQRLLTDAYWNATADMLAEGSVREQVEAQFAPLREAGQFAGHQLVSSTFRSFDRQSDELAVVTVRERWQDELYDGANVDFTPLATRGPYELDVTYTLEQGADGWVVTNMVHESEPPEWVEAP
jgi:hypothetical protein